MCNMFSVVPFHVKLAHIDYSLLDQTICNTTDTETSDMSVSTNSSKAHTPLLLNSESRLLDLVEEYRDEIDNLKGGADNNLVVGISRNPVSPVLSFTGTTASTDSAFQSLPPVLVVEQCSDEGEYALEEQRELATTIDTTTSIDSALYSLPAGVSTHQQREIETSSEEEDKEMNVQKIIKGLNHKPSSPKMSQRNRGRCARCGKLVYFAERKVAMGQQWHQQCFRCATCGRFLDPGKHCEHDGKPYCNMCYKNNFGPDGFRVGSIQTRPILEPPQTSEEKTDILTKIQRYNSYKEHNIEHIKHKEVNGRMLFEGVIKIYWGLKKHIVLASNNSNYGRQRARESTYNYVSIDDEGFDKMISHAQHDEGDLNKEEFQRYLELAQFSLGTDELISKGLNETALEAFTNGTLNTDGAVSDVHTISEENEISQEYVLVHSGDGDTDDEYSEERQCQSLTNSPSRHRVVYRQKSELNDSMQSSTMRERANSGVRRRSASFRKVQKYKKQEAREDKRSKFIPPYGKSTNLRISNLQRTEEVIGMLLLKYNVENKPSEFSLTIVHDNGVMEKLELSDSPLNVRLRLGPSEDVAKIYVMEASDSDKLAVSQEAAEYMSFQVPELVVFLKKFQEEEERELEKIRKRFQYWKELIDDTLKNRDPLISQ